MLNMKYCRTENVIAALREWIDDPGSDEELHDTLARICLQVATDAGLGAGRELGRSKGHAHQPPSTPVGVEWPLSLLRAGHWREVHIGRRYMRLEITYDYATWKRLMAEVESALAQQPAAVRVEDTALEMFTKQADKLAAPWERQWEPTKEFWRGRAKEALAQQSSAVDFVGIANRAQEVLGRGVMPSTVKAVLEAAGQQPAAVDAHELWAAAQLVPGEGIEDGVSRIEDILHVYAQPEPDKYCYTQENGECISTDPRCMHNKFVAVDEDWRKKAAEWLEAKAVEQEAANQKWPEHAAAYKTWRDRPGVLRQLATEVLNAKLGGNDDE